MISPPDHLARISPVDRSQSARILGLPSLLLSAIALTVFQAGWVLLMFTGLLMINVSGAFAVVLLLFSLSWLCLQFALVFLYPEWPLNRVLSHRLLQSLAKRDAPLVPPGDSATRVVELVPRSRWSKLALESATDLMLIRIDAEGVWMSGDRREYYLPRNSILGAELQSIKPSGWFTHSHMVIVFARSEEGQIELPLAYRDHPLGSLRSSRRRSEAIELADRINAIARGNFYHPPIEPDRKPRLESNRWSENPFEAPTVI